MRGRKPKPTQLRLLQGNPGKRPLRENEPRPEGDLFEAPADLPEQAVPFWTRAIADAPAGLLKNLDQRMLFAWSVAAWLHSEAIAQLSATTLLARAGKDGAIQQNPLLPIVNRQADIMRRMAVEMGFTPTSRSRISIEGAEGEADPFARFA